MLREYTLQDVGLGFNAFGSRNDTTKQTPDDSMNNDPGLNAWVIANEPDILNACRACLRRRGCWLVLFELRRGLSRKKKLTAGEVTHRGKTVHIVGC